MFYIVGTPIGNLGDMTYRAVETLKNVDYILCEDTRTSSNLLRAYDISTPTQSYHKFNENMRKDSILRDLKEGKNIALISDAGMPLISDPGAVIVKYLIEEGIAYTVIPGACAYLNAVILAGVDEPFTFFGFLKTKKERTSQLERIKENKSVSVLYVSCHDIDSDLKDLYDTLGDRRACMVREITKLHEEVVWFDLKDGYTGDRRGEFVLVIFPKADETNPFENMTIEEHISHYLDLGFNKNDAVKLVATDRKMKKNEVYKYAINIK